mgnify:CR=1 FL=1
MKYLVNPSKNLSWTVKISWSKNATLPILAATLILRWKVKLNNITRISDVMTFLEIVNTMWVTYNFEWSSLIIDTTNIDISKLNWEMIRKIRASILLLSPLLHYFGWISIPFPGGCSIWKRPIDAHLNWLKAIWYDYELVDDKINISGASLSWDIILNAWFWVTSTENLIVANVLRPWITTIKSWAFEPHVINLIDFLRKAWANIALKYDHTIIITWVEKLDTDYEFDIVSDYIESSTFMVIAALASKDYLDIENARIDDLYAFIDKLHEAWVKTQDMWNDTLRVYRCENIKNISIQTNIYPGFPTDSQSPFAVLMTQANGTSQIHEILFEWRLNFLVELDKMWWHTAVLNPHQALIFGKMDLKWAEVTSWDLRAWAAMVIAWLIAKWTTIVTNIEYIERWYESFGRNCFNSW